MKNGIVHQKLSFLDSSLVIALEEDNVKVSCASQQRVCESDPGSLLEALATSLIRQAFQRTVKRQRHSIQAQERPSGLQAEARFLHHTPYSCSLGFDQTSAVGAK